MATAFISDLHLDAASPLRVECFKRFTQGMARDFDALFVLGDFAEYWLGDDEDDTTLTHCFAHLGELAAAGTRVAFLVGNRDFLISADYLSRWQIQLLKETDIHEIEGVPTLLLHGDTLCTDDIAYQEFRQSVRNESWQLKFLAKPLAERRQIVTELRHTSAHATTLKQAEIMDVNLDAVMQCFAEFNVTRMVHGHTHRQARHDYSFNGDIVSRWVLGDWSHIGNALLVTAGNKPEFIEIR